MASTIQFASDGLSVDGFPIVGGHRLRFHCRVLCLPPPGDDVRLIGDASVMIELTGSGPKILGLARQTSVTVLSERNPSASIELALDMTREKLELLERQRRGRDLTVIIDPAIHAVSGDRNLTSLTTQARLMIPALHWAAVLDQVRFAEAFSLIIPLGDAEAPTRHASDELKRARRALDEGRYEDSISSARKVIEQLWRSPDGQSRVTSKGTQRSKSDRVAATADALYDLCSAAQHADQHTIGISWTRRDAVLILSAVASLLAWQAEGVSTGLDADS